MGIDNYGFCFDVSCYLIGNYELSLSLSVGNNFQGAVPNATLRSMPRKSPGIVARGYCLHWQIRFFDAYAWLVTDIFV